MKVKNYIINTLKYNIDLKKLRNYNGEILQNLEIKVVPLTNRSMLEIEFLILGKKIENDKELEEVFNLKVIYRVSFDKTLKFDDKKNIEESLKLFFPNFYNFIKNFYINEAGLDYLEPPQI